MISVLILTRNEEQDLPGCLDSVAWCDDVHVFDSESTDRTAALAHARGASVTTRRFDGYARQRNASLQLPFRHPWVLVLDADERPTPELSTEMLRAVASAPDAVSAFRIRRRDFLWGTWLKHAQITPYYLRLLRPSRVHYTRDINEVVEVEGDILKLEAPLDHLAFSKGLAHWVSKHNQYSTQEAELLASGDATRGASLREALFAPDFHTRRVAQKAIFYRLPARPFIKWLYMMFVRGAVLDGPAGTMYATLQSFYEYLIEVKRREIIRRREGKPF
ncbi:MAG TPA: glycosyltransferase family 2 protein [Acidobacteriaceae bacterium]|jgi:glycosyltransferase involved in cell wall biosynthesis|nr:glycosyltransferase family 2 protein [Acidobacteriaceae bacterium]